MSCSADDEADRIPIAEGTSIVVGRGRGEARYDVRSLLVDGQSRLVSRDHLRLTNTSGRLHVEELGSRNGTTLIRTGGGESRLQVGVLQILEPNGPDQHRERCSPDPRIGAETRSRALRARPYDRTLAELREELIPHVVA